jgi:type I restriction enzyme, S subunit
MSAVLDKWRIAKISDFAKTTSGGTPSRANPEFYTGNIPWIKSGDLNDGNVSEATEFITEEALKSSSAKLFPAGTLMIALYGATIGKLGILTIDAATNQAVCGIFVPEGVETKYLFYFLLQHRRELIKQGAGGAQPNISQGIVRDIEVPLPPLPEQRRIVARIEELFSRLDAGVAALRHAKAQLQRYRQSVLAAAVTGQLTQAWREQHPDTEPAEELLERILEQRREQWDGRGDLKVPIAPEPKAFESLPTTWVPTTISALGVVKGGKRLPKDTSYADRQTDHPYIRVVDFDSFTICRDDLRYLEPEVQAQISRYTISSSDIYISIAGTIGVVGTIPDDLDGANLTENAAKITGLIETSQKFLCYWIASAPCRNFVVEQTKTTAQPKLALYRIEQIPVPLPPLAEQQQIVAEVEARTTAIDHLEAELDRQITRSNRLRQSTLATAFKGDL